MRVPWKKESLLCSDIGGRKENNHARVSQHPQRHQIGSVTRQRAPRLHYLVARKSRLVLVRAYCRPCNQVHPEANETIDSPRACRFYTIQPECPLSAPGLTVGDHIGLLASLLDD